MVAAALLLAKRDFGCLSLMQKINHDHVQYEYFWNFYEINT